MMPKIEERLTICAAGCFSRCGRKARVACTTPQKLMLISQSICACSTSLKLPSSATPALLMTMLRPRWEAMAAAAKSWICLTSATSTRCVVTSRVPALPISAAVCCRPASSRSASARSQPRAANSSANARPMPLAAPVTAAADPLIAVIGCESGEAAELVLEQADASLVLLMTDVNLAGHMNGVELAHVAKKFNPDMDVIVTSGKPLRQQLPEGAQFWSKPWTPLDVLREAERMSRAWSRVGEA